MLKSPVLTLLVFFLGTIHVRSVHAQENSLSPPACSQTVYFRFDKAEVESAYMDNRHALSALDSLFSDPVYVWSIDSILHPKVRVITTLSSPAVVHRP